MVKQLDNKEVSVLLALPAETKPEIKGTAGYKLSRKCLHMCSIKRNISPQEGDQAVSAVPAVDVSNVQVTRNRLTTKPF
jgi:hypothetical protein